MVRELRGVEPSSQRVNEFVTCGESNPDTLTLTLYKIGSGVPEIIFRIFSQSFFYIEFLEFRKTELIEYRQENFFKSIRE